MQDTWHETQEVEYVTGECDDSNMDGIVNLNGNGCGEYSSNSDWCDEMYDTPDFSSVFCCACGGGTLLPVSYQPALRSTYSNATTK